MIKDPRIICHIEASMYNRPIPRIIYIFRILTENTDLKLWLPANRNKKAVGIPSEEFYPK